MPVPGTLKRVPINEHEVTELLEAKFGIEPSLTAAYLRLVLYGEHSEGELARSIGMSASDTKVLLEQMIAQGWIIRKSSDTPKFAALHPRMTMTNIFKVCEKQLVETLRDRRATLDRVVNLLTPAYEDRE